MCVCVTQEIYVHNLHASYRPIIHTVYTFTVANQYKREYQWQWAKSPFGRNLQRYVKLSLF